MKFVPLIGSPPMPTQVRLAEAGASQLVDDFVGERSGAAHHADAARRADAAGNDPDLATCPGVMRPGQFGPMSRAPFSFTNG